jgi:uncharacterized protein (TIGR03435 family)
MDDLAKVMQSYVLDRPVLDRTGIAGKYNLTLKWTPDETQLHGLRGDTPPPAADVTADPGLFTAIQEQLGLKMDAVKAVTEVFIVDHVEKPSAN